MGRPAPPKLILVVPLPQASTANDRRQSQPPQRHSATSQAIEEMSMSSSREVAVRRLAHREGLTLEKSRTRKTNATDQGGYRLVDPYFNETVLGERFEYNLDEVEAFLRQHWE